MNQDSDSLEERKTFEDRQHLRQNITKDSSLILSFSNELDDSNNVKTSNQNEQDRVEISINTDQNSAQIEVVGNRYHEHGVQPMEQQTSPIEHRSNQKDSGNPINIFNQNSFKTDKQTSKIQESDIGTENQATELSQQPNAQEGIKSENQNMEHAKTLIGQMQEMDDRVKSYLLNQHPPMTSENKEQADASMAFDLLDQLKSNQSNNDHTYDSIILRLKILMAKNDAAKMRDVRSDANSKVIQRVGLIANLFNIVTVYCQADQKSQCLTQSITHLIVSISLCLIQSNEKWMTFDIGHKRSVKNYLVMLIGTTCLLRNEHIEINLIVQSIASCIFLVYTQWSANFQFELAFFMLMYFISQILMMWTAGNLSINTWVILGYVFIVNMKFIMVKGVVRMQQQRDLLINQMDYTNISHIFETTLNKSLELSNRSKQYRHKKYSPKYSHKSIGLEKSDISQQKNQEHIFQEVISGSLSDNESYHVKRDPEKRLLIESLQDQIIKREKLDINNQEEKIQKNQEDNSNVLNVEKMICQNFFASSLVLKFEKHRNSLNFNDNLSQIQKSNVNKSKFKLIQMTRGFFNKLPKVNQTNQIINHSQKLNFSSISLDNHEIQKVSKQNQRSNSRHQSQSNLIPNMFASVSEGDYLLDPNYSFLSENDQQNTTQRLNQKIFKPYFISNQTLLHFQKFSNCRLSTIDIIEHFVSSQNKVLAKFYFKVEKCSNSNYSYTDYTNNFAFDVEDNFSYKSEEKNKNTSSIFTPEFQEYIKTPVRSRSNCVCGTNITQNKIKSMHNQNAKNSKNGSNNSDKIIRSRRSQRDSEISVHFDDFGNRANEIQQEDNEIKYFEFELKIIDQQELSDCSYAKSQTFQQTFKIGLDENMILINVRDISNFIKNLQNTTDKIYFDAIEANYSHESMTPLNCIIANTRIAQKRLRNITMSIMNQEKYSQSESKNNEVQGHHQTLKLLNAVEQSGQAMRFNCNNHVKRMQIRRGQFKSQMKIINNLEQKIFEVIDPFAHQIESRQLNIYFIIKNPTNANILIDSKTYQLILFNIVQNAVKYNQFKGEILIQLVVKPQLKHKLSRVPFYANIGSYSQSKSGSLRSKYQDSEENLEDFVLETQIIDTGIGIAQERQKLLFTPLQELKYTKDFNLVKDFNIGLGLACSKSLTNGLQGDIVLKQSERGFTVFAFRIPIQINLDENNGFQNSSSQKVVKLHGSYELVMSQKLQNYVKQELRTNTLRMINNIDKMKNRSRTAAMVHKNNNLNQKKQIQQVGSLESSQKIIMNHNSQQIVNQIDQFQLVDNFLAVESQRQNPVGKQKLINAIIFSNLPINSNRRDSENNSFQINERVRSLDVNDYQFSDSNEEHEQLPEESKDEERKESQNLSKNSLIYNHTSYEMESSQRNSIFDDDDQEQEDDESQSISHSSQNSDEVEQIIERVRPLKNLISSSFKSQSQEEIKKDQDQIRESLQQSSQYSVVHSSLAKKKSDRSNKSKQSSSNSSGQVRRHLIHQMNQKIQEVNESREIENNSAMSKSVSRHQSCTCKEKILVVDDQEFNIQVVKNMMLEEFDIQVDSALNGKQAVEMYKSDFLKRCNCVNRIYKLILMDIQMPVMNGIEATKQIIKIMRNQMPEKSKKSSDKSQIPTHVVALTSYTNKASQCKEAGFSNIYNKPLNFKDLHRIIWIHHNRVQNKKYIEIQNLRFQSKEQKISLSSNVADSNDLSY